MWFLAASFGMIALPSYILYRAIRTFFILGLAFIIGIPIAMRYAFKYLNDIGLPLMLNIVLCVFVAFPMMIVFVPCAVAAAVVALVILSLIELMTNCINGFITGYREGKEGVLLELRRMETVAEELEKLTLDLLFDIGPAEEERTDNETTSVETFAIAQQFLANLEASPSPVHYEQLLVTHPLKVEEWTMEEEAILKNLMLNNKNNPVAIGSQKEKILTILENTHALYCELQQKWSPTFKELKKNFKLSIGLRDYSKIENTLSPYDDISKPILLVKEYYIDGAYRAVPANIYITDKDFFLKCIKERPTNPHNRDHLMHPPKETRGEAKDRPVCYRVYSLNEEYHSASFLDQEIVRMRQLLTSPHLELQEILPSVSKVSVSNIPQAFFKVPATENNHNEELFLNDEDFSTEDIEELFAQALNY